MSAPLRYLQPLRRAWAAFFQHELALRRAEDGVRLVLEERPAKGGTPSARPPTRAELVAQKDAQDLAAMREQLAVLLDELPETRQTLRHLVFVEQALARKGLRALHKLPLDVLQRALEQLEGLVINWTPTGLASLRSKMAVALIEREHMDPEAEGGPNRRSTVQDSVDPMPDAELPACAPSRADDDALAAAYAALGDVAPAVVVEMQGELASASSRALSRAAARPAPRSNAGEVDIVLRELQG